MAILSLNGQSFSGFQGHLKLLPCKHTEISKQHFGPPASTSETSTCSHKMINMKPHSFLQKGGESVFCILALLQLSICRKEDLLSNQYHPFPVPGINPVNVMIVLCLQFLRNCNNSLDTLFICKYISLDGLMFLGSSFYSRKVKTKVILRNKTLVFTQPSLTHAGLSVKPCCQLLQFLLPDQLLTQSKLPKEQYRTPLIRLLAHPVQQKIYAHVFLSSESEVMKTQICHHNFHHT